MNENAFDALKYMCIHLFIFLFKNFFAKWLLDFSNKGISNKHKNELELLKQQLADFGNNCCESGVLFEFEYCKQINS